MKKIMALLLLSAVPSFIHTMEQQQINPVLQAIKNRLGSMFASIKITGESSDGTKIAVLSTTGTISLWNGKTGDMLEWKLAEDQNDVLSLGFNKDGTKVIATTSKGSREFDIINAEVLATIRDRLFNMMSSIKMTAQSTDKTKIAVLSTIGTISLWDGESGRLLNFHIAEDQKDALSLGFNEDGTKVIVTTPDGQKEFPAEKSRY